MTRILSVLAILSFVVLFTWCGGSDTPSTGAKFSIKGTSGAIAVALGDRNASRADTVTHVMAVSPTSQNATRILAPVTGGTFTLEVTGGRPYVLVFIDSTQIGADMIVGYFTANTLNSVAPLASVGEINLGTLNIASGVAAAGITYADLLTGLGITAAEADYLGSIDDLCLRYINPDIDSNGVIDTEETGHGFMLDFHTHFAMSPAAGGDIPIADIVGAYAPDTSTVNYGGTGAYVAFPTAFSAATTGSVTAGGVTQSGLVTNGFGDYNGFGPYYNDPTEIPSGTYVYSFDGKTLTFTNVVTRTVAELNAAVNMIVPFVKFNKTDTACTSSCTIASMDWKWMKNTASGFVPATLSELQLTVNDVGGYISIRKGPSGGGNVGFQFPITALSGNIPWTSAASTGFTGMTEAEFLAWPTEELCNFGFSYDDKLGLRNFFSYSDGAACI